MKFCNMAVVVPVDQLTGSKAALSAGLGTGIQSADACLGESCTASSIPQMTHGAISSPALSVWCWAVRSRAVLNALPGRAADTAGGRCISRSRHDQKGGYGQGAESRRFAHLPRSGRWQRSGADDSRAVAHFAAKRRAAPRLRDLLCRPRACGRISRGTAGDSVKPCQICLCIVRLSPEVEKKDDSI